MANDRKSSSQGVLLWIAYGLLVSFLVLGSAFFYGAIQDQKDGPRIVRGNDVTCVLMGQALQCWPEVTDSSYPAAPELQQQRFRL